MVRLSFILLFFSSAIFAHDDLEKIVTLAEDARDVVTEMEGEKTKRFILSEETTDFVQSLQAMDQEIASIVPQSLVDPNDQGGEVNQEPCHDEYSINSDLAERIKGRKFKLYFTASFSEGAELGLNPGFSGRNNYTRFMGSQVGDHPNAGKIRTLKALENRYKSEKGDQGWDNLSLVEKSKALQEFAAEFSGAKPSLGLILSEYAIADMTASPDSWKDSLKEIKDHLSFDEKLKVASHFGGRFSDRYNYDRAEGVGSRANGIVTIEEMLASVRDGTPGGVCRDVSQAQSLMLQEMGVDASDIYQVSYRTGGGGHVVLAVQDPDNPKRIVKINYDYTDETSDRTGGAALTQNSSLPEFGHQFRIYDAQGKPIATVPTEMGDVMREVTRGRSLEDGLTKNHNLQRVYVDTPHGVGSVFTGSTSSGDKIVGVSLSKDNPAVANSIETDYGITYVQREGSRATLDVSEKALYGFMRSTYHSPRLQRGNLSFGSKVGTDVEISFSDNRTEYDYGYTREDQNYDGRVGAIAGIDVGYESDDGKTRANTSLTYEGFLNHKFEQEGPDSGLMLATDKIVWATSVERDISPQMTFTGESAIILRDIGNTGVFKGQLENPSRGIAGYMSYQTPLSDDVPGLNPLSTEVVGVGLEKTWSSPNKKVSGGLILEYGYDMDLKQNTANAGFGIKW